MTRRGGGKGGAVLALTMVLLVGATIPLRAQHTKLTDRFPALIADQLQTIVDSAGHAGLPTLPLVLRALEGQAKGASTTQITDAMIRLRSALITARATLGPRADAMELETAAAALQASVPTERLAELHRLCGDLPITVPLSAYLDLVTRGARADRAWSTIAELARHRASNSDFRRLTPTEINRDPRPVRVPAPPPTGGGSGGGAGAAPS